MPPRDPSTSRREALRLMAAAIAGGACLPRALDALSPHTVPTAMPQSPPRAGSPAIDRERIEAIGLQLYTVRSALSRDLEGTLDAIAAAGITELEFAGYYNKPAAWWQEQMHRRGVTAPSTHIGFPATDADWEPQFAMAQAMGHQWVIVPSLRADWHTADGYHRAAERLMQAAGLAKAHGLRMGYHNHDAEFAPLAGSAEHGFAILLANTDAALIDFELDLYWAVKAGQDPLALIRTHGARIACCHVKDAGPAPAREMLDVGAGTIDFKTILSVGRAAGLRHWYIEHDQPTNPLASIAASAAAMRRY
ncbi:MAG: sugar phosphate isomerase/epimerase [Gemmatimonadaceae bacterium]